MNRWLLCLLCAVGIASFARRCPAPVIYRPGEGWTYEPVGSSGKWIRNRSKEQLEVAQQAFDRKDYRLALKAATRVVHVWPRGDHAGAAQFLIGRCYEARHMDERAFKEYQKALTRYPKITNFTDVLQRQYEIGQRFLGGQWFKLWGYIPFFPSMDRTAQLFEQIAKTGPYHPTGAAAQMAVGEAREKQREYPLAVKAYETAADRYHDRPEIAANATYKAGLAWNKQAKRAEYDQAASVNAIDTMNDFKALYPKDPRLPAATQIIIDLKAEQARGAFATARFYEKYHRYQGASVYYSEVVYKDPNSALAQEAKQRIAALKPRVDEQARKVTEADARFREATKKSAAPDPKKK